jgi:hypothetical protein
MVVSENSGIEGKVALITGGTSGIGKPAALAAMGAEPRNPELPGFQAVYEDPGAGG